MPTATPPVRFAALLLAACLPWAAQADSTTGNADTVFNWAEKTYPSYFPAGPLSQSAGGYYYRGPYSSSYYLGVSTGGTPHVLLLNAKESVGLVDVGLLSELLSKATAGTAAPSGTPPSGTPPSGSAAACAAVYVLSGGSTSQSGQSYSSSAADTSGICVQDAGSLTLSNPTVSTSGATSSLDNSSFYGLNAGILATAGSSIKVSGGSIVTAGSGGNGAFATGSGSTIALDKLSITASGQGGHGVDATLGGTLLLTDVTASTTGANGSVIATDRGGGTITVSGGSFSAAGVDSAGIYSTGAISVSGATIKSSGGEAVVVEGKNSATLANSTLSAAKGTRDRGMLVYQSESGDASSGSGELSISGGSYTWPSTTGPAFYVTNTDAVIKLSGVAIGNSSPILLKAAADQWGRSGANGGKVTLLASGQALSGSLVADSVSTLSVSLSNGSTLSGAINSAGSAQAASLTLDAGSRWNVTANSLLSAFSGSVDSIVGNGYTVTYDASLAANSALAGKSYSLAGGGSLRPK